MRVGVCMCACGCGPIFLREPSWKYSSKLYSGPESFAQHVLRTFALLDDHCL